MEVVKDKVYELMELYDWCWSQTDERVADWPLMQSFVPTIILTILYITVVVWGKRYMSQRKEGFELRALMIFYNLFLVALNLYICSELFMAALSAGYSFTCQSVSYTYDYNEMRIAKALWWYYLSKLIEFSDTFIFILRKKFNQVSFLHVYHHASMFPLWWIGIKWVAGGQAFFGALINSWVHVVMYLYYALTAMGPSVQKYLWWKKYLTLLQLIQFNVGIGHAIYSLYVDCDFPRWMHWGLIIYAGTIYGLFVNFYIHSYIMKKTRSKTGQGVSNGCGHSHGAAQNGETKKIK